MEFFVEIVKWVRHTISRFVGDMKDVDQNLDKLTREADELRCMRDGTQTEVSQAEASGKVPAPLVKNWLAVANSSIAQVDSIRSELEGGRRSWFCADLNLRCKWGKRVHSQIDEVRTHKRKWKDLEDWEVAKRARCSRMPEKWDVPREVEEQSSSKEAVGKISQWLEDEAISIICVWGMGGVGKTTLVKQLCNKLQGTNDFQQVIWVTVSKDRNLEAIRQRIANKLQLKFAANEGLEDKQEKLRATLNRVKYILILDDLWQKLSLEEVGIPWPNKENRCKIVITTRKNEVINAMDADQKIKIEPLRPDEAWNLFYSKTGDVILSTKIKPIAERVLAECCGLPLAIITVGRAMRLKTKTELWQNALTTLRSADPQISGMEGEVFRLLKLSYDYLEDPQIKSCFLDCALYPEDYRIDAEKLVQLWAFGERLVDNALTLDDALNKGHSILENLVDACLLEKESFSDVTEMVKMHDLIRDLAIWITSPSSSSSFQGQKFLVNAGERLKQPPEEKHWEGMAKISLMQNQLKEIQVTPNCPDLVSLLLSENAQLHIIGDHFFESMTELQILDLSRTGIESLPSLSRLVNLRVLNVSDCCRLKALPSLGDLKELEFLDLCGSGIMNWPGGITNLSKLKFLNVATETDVLGRIPHNEISKLTSLEDLRLVSRNASKKVNDKMNVDTLREAGTLPRLTCLQIHLRPVFDAFTRDAMNHQMWSHLTRYTVYASYDVFKEYFMYGMLDGDADYYYNFSKMVYIFRCEVFDGQISCIRYAEGLKMEECKCLQTLTQIIGESTTLKCIILQHVEGLRCVIDWTEMGEDNAILGNLETLWVSELASLERVFGVALRQRMTASFGLLRKIYVSKCPKLTCIFSCTMLEHLHQLEYLQAESCEQLEEIVEGGPFPDRMQLKLTDLVLDNLPKLTTICRQHLDLSSDRMHIRISLCPLLKKLPALCSDNSTQHIRGRISGSRKWWERIEWENDHSKSTYSTLYEEKEKEEEEEEDALDLNQIPCEQGRGDDELVCDILSRPLSLWPRTSDNDSVHDTYVYS